MIVCLIIGIILFVLGCIVVFSDLDDISVRGIIWCGLWSIGLFLIGVWVGFIHSTPEIIFPEDITYKSIDVQDAEYYIVDKDGNIYEITQEQWANLDVPIVPNMEN
jgi:hypothetical protein